MAARHQSSSERGQLNLFRALPGDFAPRDAQDLMAYPFFSLAKSKRIAPIDFKAGDVTIRVEAVPDHGMATIWDADILIWAASQIVEARDAGLRTSRLMATTPYEILTFVGRGVSLRDYQRLKAALDRLQSTTVATSIRQPAEGRRHRFSWINEWQERTDRDGRPVGVELILPDWFYRAVLDDALVLTIDRAYFDLTGGLERWLYRVVRKHGGRQSFGWSFDFAPPAPEIRQPLAAEAFRLRPARHHPPPAPAWLPARHHTAGGWSRTAHLRRNRSNLFHPAAPATEAVNALWGQAVNSLVLSGTAPIVPSGTRSSCYRGPESTIHRRDSKACDGRNFSNLDSFGIFLTPPHFCTPADNLRNDGAKAGNGWQSAAVLLLKSETRFPLIVNWLCRFTVGGAP
jgi:hypothetical protein